MLNFLGNYPEFYIMYQNAIIIDYSKHIKDKYITLICFEKKIMIVFDIMHKIQCNFYDNKAFKLQERAI